MKYILLLFSLCSVAELIGQYEALATANPIIINHDISFEAKNSYTTNTQSDFGLDDILEYFEQSDIFDEGNSFLWIDYQLASNRYKRDDYKNVIVPPLGINYEMRIFHNLGVRVSYSLNWWKENIVLVKSEKNVFTQEFNLYYNTFSLGLNWHIPINDRLDPYTGLSYSYRNIHAKCECKKKTNTSSNIDFLIGTRYMLTDRIMVSGEIGHTGTGYFKFGTGYAFGNF